MNSTIMVAFGEGPRVAKVGKEIYFGASDELSVFSPNWFLHEFYQHVGPACQQHILQKRAAELRLGFEDSTMFQRLLILPVAVSTLAAVRHTSELQPTRNDRKVASKAWAGAARLKDVSQGGLLSSNCLKSSVFLLSKSLVNNYGPPKSGIRRFCSLQCSLLSST